MEKIRKKGINGICKEIDLKIDGADNRIDYKFIFLHLDEALTKNISYDEIVLICDTAIKIAKTKNRIIRHLEKDIWSFINRIPFQIIVVQGLDIDDNEELLSSTNYDNTSKRILSRLIKLAQEILEIKDNNSKGGDLRRAGSLKLLVEMINHFHIPAAKKLFVDSINSKNVKEQFAALEGLENYYNFTDDEIDEDLIQNLNLIKKKTDDRTVASTCLQIQINAGLIDEMIAALEIDNWKDDHYDYR